MHQLWRMQHGEIFQKHQPHLAIVMLGTNDLGAASCLGTGEAPILQAAAGTADRCNYEQTFSFETGHLAAWQT